MKKRLAKSNKSNDKDEVKKNSGKPSYHKKEFSDDSKNNNFYKYQENIHKKTSQIKNYSNKRIKNTSKSFINLFDNDPDDSDDFEIPYEINTVNSGGKSNKNIKLNNNTSSFKFKNINKEEEVNHDVSLLKKKTQRNKSRNNDDIIRYRFNKSGIIMLYEDLSIDIGKIDKLISIIKNEYKDCFYYYIGISYNNCTYVFINYPNLFVDKIIYMEHEPKIIYAENYKKIMSLCKKTDNYVTNIEFDFNDIEKDDIFKTDYENMDIRNWKYFLDFKDFPETLKGINLAKKLEQKKKIQKKRRYIWLFGILSGKTTVVHNTFKNIYNKDINNIWENYNNEKVVCVELNKDYSPKIGNVLKELTENVTHDLSNRNFNLLIVLANQCIQEYFQNNSALRLTMLNRFQQMCMKKLDESEDIANCLLSEEYYNKYMIKKQEENN